MLKFALNNNFVVHNHVFMVHSYQELLDFV
ncbi:unnamed protein product, partial [Vitis vinifera]|uniref:Uncharacterized protein n=1 Tax=Vitis vinifera TaxID=29760 RepID=D7SHT4_VITVI